jgi:ribosomal protein S27AE
MTNYKNTRCWKCDSDIMVATHDYAERNYCNTCAWDKLYDNRTVEAVNE